jgi:hypothetical protein
MMSKADLTYPWSHTKLSIYESCPQHKKFRYDMRLPQPVKSEQAARGTETHASIEDVLNKVSRKLPVHMQPFRHVIEKVRSEDPFVEMQVGFDRDWKWADFQNGWGRGVIDSAYINGDEVHVQEWKTGRIYDEHEQQRRLYLLAACVQWPAARLYEIQTYYFDQGVKKRMSLLKSDMPPLRKNFTHRVTVMEKDDIMAPRPGMHCRWCPYSKTKGGPCRKG